MLGEHGIHVRCRPPSPLPLSRTGTNSFPNLGRGYDTFWTQWTVGTAEFSDEPMPRPPDEDIYLEFFKAKHTTKYLENYVDSHIYLNETLRDRIKFSVEVKSLQKTNKIWNVHSQGRGADGIQQAFNTPRLIIASGLTSIPNIPHLENREKFGGRILHHEDFGSSDVLASPDVKRIAILGAGKSSADMAYEAVKAGKSVSWIIKATKTTGPGFFLSPAGKGPYKNAFEIGIYDLKLTCVIDGTNRTRRYDPSRWLIHAFLYERGQLVDTTASFIDIWAETHE